MAGAENAAEALTVKVLRPTSGAPRSGRVTARDMRGLVLAEAPFTLPEGASEVDARFDLPVELRNEVARLEIAGEHSAGAVQLLDKRWRRRSVGVVSGTSTDTGQPLLAPTYYLSRALGPFADLRVAETGSATENINRFLDQRLPVLALTDVGTIPPATRNRLAKFVEDGGVLIRFAGPRLANAQDDLLPVRLRRGGRVLGGSLSWETPQKLGSLTPEGPFRDIKPADDVTGEPAGTRRTGRHPRRPHLGDAGRRHAPRHRHPSGQGRAGAVPCHRRHVLVEPPPFRHIR